MTNEEIMVHLGYIRSDIKEIKERLEKNTDAQWAAINANREKISSLKGASAVISSISGAITAVLIELGLRK